VCFESISCFGIFASEHHTPRVRRATHNRRSARLRALLIATRRAHNISQTVLADRLARPQSFVSKFESGERRLDVVEFLEVVEALGADPLAILAELRRV
jgi:DNA-binding transcriptional regulator YiaG